MGPHMPGSVEADAAKGKEKTPEKQK